MIGKMISHYRIIKKAGGGGMGIVYQAEDIKLNRPVAIKLLPPAVSNDPVAKERFIQEAKSASILQHQNICTIHEIDETEDGQLFMVMDYYQGETLKERLTKGPLETGTTVDFARQIAAGLAQAHARDIIHRDIKPTNIFITGEDQVKLLDFGLAKFAGQARLTRDGLTIGTIAYMSPEQAKGEEVDGRSDIWSLGVILYEMLTGNLPFRGEYDQAIVYSILNEQPQPLSEAGIKIPEKLIAVVTRCLEKNKENRYQNIGELIGDLKDLKTELISRRRKRKTLSLKNMIYGLGGTLIVILLLIALFLNPFERGPRQVVLSNTTPLHKKSLAVLYFENLSAQDEGDVLCAGMTEGVITSLAKLGKLDVKTRSDVLPYKNKQIDMPALRDDLNIDAVLQSSLSLAGSTVQINARLLDAATDNPVWSNQFEANKQDILSIQDQIAQQVARALGVRLEGIQADILTAQPTSDAKAFEWASQGIYYKDRGMLDFAMTTFDSAISHDPGYALAHFYQGKVYEKLEKYAQAIHSYQLALPKSEKFQRILWDWPAPVGEKLQWRMGLYDIGIEQKNIVFSIQPDLKHNTSIVNAFDISKKQQIWTQTIPAIIRYGNKLHNNKLMIRTNLGSENNPAGIKIYAIDIYSGEIVSEKTMTKKLDYSDWIYEHNYFISNVNEKQNVPLLMYILHDQQLEIVNLGQGDSYFKTIFKYDVSQFEIPLCILFPAASGKYSVLVLWNTRNLTLIDSEEGKIIWDSKANSTQIGFFNQTTIFSANRDCREVQAINAQTGKVKWIYSIDAGIRELAVEPEEKLVLLAQENGKLTALRMDKGLFQWSRKAWQVETGEPEFKIYSHDPQNENYLPLVYLVSPGGIITTVDKSSGTVVSRINTGDENIRLHVNRGNLFGTARNKIFRLEARQGTILWNVRHSSSNCWPWDKIDDKLIVRMNRMVSAYDLEYGDLLWQFHTGAVYPEVYTNPDEKKVLVGDEYHLYQLNLKSNPEDKIVDEKKILFNMARCSAAGGKYDPAIKLLDQITTQIDPGYFPAYKELAQVYRTIKNQNAEIRNLVKYSDFFPLHSVELQWVQNRLADISGLQWIKGLPKGDLDYLTGIDSIIYGSGFGEYDRDIYLTAFNIKNGDILWSKKFFEEAIVRERACANDNIYITAGSKSSLTHLSESLVISLAKQSGEVNWQKDFTAGSGADIKLMRVKDGLIYMLGKSVAKDFITCCLTATGEPVWSLDRKAGSLENLELCVENLIYSTQDSLFFADRKSGAEIWSYHLADSAAIEDFSWKGIQNGRIIFTTKDGYFICLNTALRKMDWKIKSPLQNAGYFPAVDLAGGDTVCDWDSYHFSAFGPDPIDKNKTRVLWNIEIAEGINYVCGYDEKCVYLKTDDNQLIIVDRVTGKILQKKQLLWEFPYSRTSLVNKNIFYGLSERLLYAMKVE
jgi:serine/threonine protein kinase/outer membrane protein assembly factor BamB